MCYKRDLVVYVIDSQSPNGFALQPRKGEAKLRSNLTEGNNYPWSPFFWKQPESGVCYCQKAFNFINIFSQGRN